MSLADGEVGAPRAALAVALAGRGAGPRRSGLYPLGKRGFDLWVCLMLLPVLVLVGLALLVLNPFLNPGRLLFVQERMGQGARPFRAWKFRTMSACDRIERGAFDPPETDRITPLGQFLRRTRLDELPQVANVLRGEMSMIGPRPDYRAHAEVYLDAVPGYRERLSVLPGISGYAQVAVGYVVGPEGVRAKVAADLLYVRRASMGFDLWVAWRTIAVVLGARGR